jgi:putative ABC transport system permease protein
VVGQVAISLMLLVAATLCVRSLYNASKIDTGFEADGVQLASVNLQTAGYDETRGREFYRRLVERVEAMPGVEGVSLARAVPLSGMMFGNSIRIEGFEPPPGQPPLYSLANTVDENYLRTLGISVLAGRELSLADNKNAGKLSVNVSRSFLPVEAAARRMRETQRLRSSASSKTDATIRSAKNRKRSSICRSRKIISAR